MTRTKRGPPILEAQRHEMARIIWDEYVNFIISGVAPGDAGDTKVVGPRHTTGKNILAHLDTLWKQGAPVEHADAGDGHHLSDARAGLAPYKGEEAEADDGGDG